MTQLEQFLTNHSAALTEKGLNPESLRTKVKTCCTTEQAAEQAQADSKTAWKDSTRNLHNAVAQRYPEFSSVIDLLRSAVGNDTPLGQATDEHPQASHPRSARAGRQVGGSNVVPAKIAA